MLHGRNPRSRWADTEDMNFERVHERASFAAPLTDAIENAVPYVADVCQRAACIAQARHRRLLGLLHKMLEEMRLHSV